MTTAPFIKRFLAAIVDHVILIVIALLIGLIFGLDLKLVPFLQFVQKSNELTTQAILSSFAQVPALIFILVYLAYFILMEATRSATLGKLLLGIEIVKEEGEKIGFREAIIRTLFRGIDATPFYFIPLYIIGLISYILSPTRQRLGDHVAQTLVVVKK